MACHFHFKEMISAPIVLLRVRLLYEPCRCVGVSVCGKITEKGRMEGEEEEGERGKRRKGREERGGREEKEEEDGEGRKRRKGREGRGGGRREEEGEGKRKEEEAQMKAEG